MPKTMCDLKKQLKSDMAAYQLLVIHGTHVCTKCGRVANDKKRLCKAEKLQRPGSSLSDHRDVA